MYASTIVGDAGGGAAAAVAPVGEPESIGGNGRASWGSSVQVSHARKSVCCWKESASQDKKNLTRSLSRVGGEEVGLDK